MDDVQLTTSASRAANLESSAAHRPRALAELLLTIFRRDAAPSESAKLSTYGHRPSKLSKGQILNYLWQSKDKSGS